MTFQEAGQVLLYFAILLALVKPLGLCMARLYQGRRTFLSPLLAPVERLFYRLAGVDATQEMDWKGYTAATGMAVLAAFVRGLTRRPEQPAHTGAETLTASLRQPGCPGD